MVPVSQPLSSSTSEHQPLLGSRNHSTPKSLLYRARRAPLAVACVAAIALFVDMVVYGVVVPILPDIVERLGGSSRDAGLLFACYAVGLLGSTPVFAYLSDHYQNRRYPMMGGMLGMAIATFSFANATNYWMLILARIGQGMAGGASWTIGLGMLADVYPPDQLGVVMGACLMFNTLGFLIGPTLGGALYEYYGLHAPFAVCAALALLDFFAVLLIAEPDKTKFAKEREQEQSEEQAGGGGGGRGKAHVDEETGLVAGRDQQEQEENLEDVVTSTKIAVGVASAASGHPEEMAHEQLLLAAEDQHRHNQHAPPHHHTAVDSAAVSNYGSMGQQAVVAPTAATAAPGPSSLSTMSSQSRSRASSMSSSASSISSNEISNGATSQQQQQQQQHHGASETHPNKTKDDGTPGSDVSYYQIATEWTMVRCLLATIVASSAYSGIEPIFPLHLKDILGAGPALTGLVFTAAVVPSFVSPLIGYLADRKGRLAVSCVGMVIFVVAAMLLAWPTTIPGFILPLALFGLGSSTILTPLLPAMAQVATVNGWNAYARVYACYNMVYSGGMMVGPILAGVLYDLLGFGWTMITFGLLGLVAIPVTFGNELLYLGRWLQGSVQRV